MKDKKMVGRIKANSKIFSSVLAVSLFVPLTIQAQKIEVCHVPGNDPENVRTIEIERNALKDHLNHGDYLGACIEDEENYFSITVAPNPFYEHTYVKYTLYEPAKITMEIYDQIGKSVKVLVDSDLEPGKYSHEFNAADFGTSRGIHFLKVTRITADRSLFTLSEW